MAGLSTMFKAEVAEKAAALIQSAYDAGGSGEYLRGYCAGLSHLLRSIGYRLNKDGSVSGIRIERR